VVPPVGEIHFAKAEISESQLKQKIQVLWPGRTGAGGGDKPLVRSGVSVTLRGGETLASNTASPQTWRDLYRLLVQPVEKWLPARAGALLTVEAHGCLLVLPFAALQTEQGHYLIERFTVHSIPAISLLQFTERKKSTGSHDTSRYLLIADPTGTPPGPNGKPLPALPGARQEISSVARLLPAASVTMLVGKDASEPRVAELAGGSTLIHLATHGVIREDDPLESYLALSRSGPGLGQDGFLTAQKVYGMELHSDLVFLSACRSGLGQLSGDGINGLTRAFMYAGTPSVIASLWDVADETTNRLVTGFYRAWLGGSDKAGALRSAQLALLGALRAGRVSVRTPYGRVVLPEDPVFWASFVLQGEP
jgi:CHAT domain-containing protein